jgi:hypothetical protein
MTLAASYQLLLTFVAESAADPISEMDNLAKTGSTAREIWKLMEQENCEKAIVG